MGTGPVSVQPAPATVTPIPATSSAATSYLPPTITVDPLLGQTLADRYQIVRKLGEGGMGAVYLATHNLLEKQVALKVLHAEFARKPDLVERFMQEAKAASRIRHENVIDISDFGATPEGFVFFAMELLQGHDLHEEVARARLAGQLLPWSRSKKIFLQICAALIAAHGKGIVHRDLKPENIYLVDFLGEPDFVKLLDFGIAKLTEVSEGDRKLTRTGMLFGTPEYMSPEQARGEHVDHRVDVYAMGCILFQLVTGRVPFEAENFMGVLSLHLTEAPPQIPAEVFDRIGAPRELAGVIAKALEKDRNVRWQTIEELGNAVRAVCGDPPARSQATGSTGHLPQQPAASVDAPASTTSRVLATPTPTPAPITGVRQRTQWTGSLSVPQHDESATVRGRSKLPWILGAVIVLGTGAAAAVLLTNRAAPAARGGGGSAIARSGSPTAAVAPPDAMPTPPPQPPSQPPLAAPPVQVTIKLDSKPSRAEIKDVASGRVLGVTPLTFKLPGSHEARQFALSLKGYGSTIVELVPDREKIEYTERLEKGAAGAAVVRKISEPGEAGSAAGSGGPGVTDAGSAAVKPLDPSTSAKPPEPPPEPDDECDDPPCLKTNVPGLRGSGTVEVGSGSSRP